MGYQLYKAIMKQIEFELGAIAYHCREIYLNNPGLYDDYIPIAMLGASNDFYNFIIDGVEPLFEFAFSNESLTESLIEFGEIKNETEQTVYYSGDAEIGVVITIHAIGNVRNITIYNTGTREVMRIDTDKLKQLTGSGMVAGDEIIISTIKGDKSITLLRNGIYTNILNCLDKDSDWFQLSKGDNRIAGKG